MRKKHIGSWIGALLCAIALVAFLSALVISPDAEAPKPLPNDFPLTATTLIPYALPLPDAQPDAPRLDLTSRCNPFFSPEAAQAMPTAQVRRDSNGHTIIEKSFLDNVYQAFRQETACG